MSEHNLITAIRKHFPAEEQALAVDALQDLIGRATKKSREGAFQIACMGEEYWIFAPIDYEGEKDPERLYFVCSCRNEDIARDVADALEQAYPKGKGWDP